MTSSVSSEAKDLAFNEARSYNRWSPEPVSDREIRDIVDLMKWGPTSANCWPARFVFARSAEAKAKLSDAVSQNNKIKVEQAPVVAIIGMDMKFADKLPILFPQTPDAKNWFANPDVARATAFRNSSLQGAYFMIAARLCGLDCGPMSGFDSGKLNAAFFAGTAVETNFICALGHGTTEMLFPRLPRLSFEEVCRFA